MEINVMTPQSKLPLRLRSLALLGLGAALLGTAPAQAQRDPAYQAARQAGQVGEQPDGYLGHVTPPTPEVRALVLDINIKRKDAYTKSAAANGSTVEQFAFTTGCNLIARTLPGEKYKSPGGQWLTRGSGPPERDSRCL
jgi:uncharacterized protein